MKLCDAPTEFNCFEVKMKTNERILEIRNKIVDNHGRYSLNSITFYRIENIKIFNKDAVKIMKDPDSKGEESKFQ
jgi:hypothetical protein